MPGSEKTVKAIEALRCIRLGMSDAELMEKFSLSAVALQNLFAQLVEAGILQASEVQERTRLHPPSVLIGIDKEKTPLFQKKKQVVDAADALNCIRQGMDDAAVMQKFALSERGLRSLLGKLLSSGVITQAELDERAAASRKPLPAEEKVQESPIADLARMGVDPDVILKDIKSGLDDIALMEKFALSAEALQVVFEELLVHGWLEPSELEDRTFVTQPSVVLSVKPAQLPEMPARKPVIDAGEALNLIKGGMDDAALMKKFDLSAKGLQSMLQKMLSAGVISKAELDERTAPSEAAVVIDEQVTEETILPEPQELMDLEKLVQDIKAGEGYEALMEKHGLSSKGLRDLLDRMIAQGVIAEDDFQRAPCLRYKELEIRSRTSGKALYRGEERSLGALVEKAVAELVNLSDADLVGVNLSRRDLSGAKLHNADMKKAILVGADLTGADLSCADLASADLYGANLYKANLSTTNLSDSNMTGVHAVWAFLARANLAEANLSKANLTGANLAGANLFESILNGTKLDGAYLNETDLGNTRKQD